MSEELCRFGVDHRMRSCYPCLQESHISLKAENEALKEQAAKDVVRMAGACELIAALKQELTEVRASAERYKLWAEKYETWQPSDPGTKEAMRWVREHWEGTSRSGPTFPETLAHALRAAMVRLEEAEKERDGLLDDLTKCAYDNQTLKVAVANAQRKMELAIKYTDTEARKMLEFLSRLGDAERELKRESYRANEAEYNLATLKARLEEAEKEIGVRKAAERALIENHCGTGCLACGSFWTNTGHGGKPWHKDGCQVAALTASLASVTKERDEARFSPLGDNHHNADACPYCSPHVVALHASLAELRKRMEKISKTNPNERCVFRGKLSRGENAVESDGPCGECIDCLLASPPSPAPVESKPKCGVCEGHPAFPSCPHCAPVESKPCPHSTCTAMHDAKGFHRAAADTAKPSPEK